MFYIRAEVGVAVRVRVGEVLPGLVRLSVVRGPLKNPDAWPRRVRHFDEYVGNMEFLSKVDGEVDLIVPRASRQRWALPPLLGAVDGVLRRVSPSRVADVAIVADLSLDQIDVGTVLGVQVSAH